MIIRDAKESDNLKMLDIQKSAAQVGEFEITLLKSDFKSKSNFFSDGFFLVAEDEKTSDIIGFMGVGIGQFKVKGKSYKGAYFYDLRTNSKYRRRVARWLKTIIEEAASRLRKMGIDFYFASVKSDNKPSIKILKHFDLDPIYNYNTYSIPVFNKFKPKGAKIEHDFNISELEDFYSEKNTDIDFLPIDLKDNFLKIIKKEKRLVKFSYKSATAYAWDTTDIADIGITKISKRLKILQKILFYSSKMIPYINAPVLNKKMKTFHIMKFDYKDEKDLKKLLKAVNSYCYKQKYYLINIFVPENKHLNENLLGKLKFRVDFTLTANSVTEVNFENLKNLIWLPRL
ncbi:MAG: N-acetyltransferase family protein [Thermotogota bacterium]